MHVSLVFVSKYHQLCPFSVLGGTYLNVSCSSKLKCSITWDSKSSSVTVWGNAASHIGQVRLTLQLKTRLKFLSDPWPRVINTIFRTSNLTFFLGYGNHFGNSVWQFSKICHFTKFNLREVRAISFWVFTLYVFHRRIACFLWRLPELALRARA